nr:hypothetical protein [Sinorhizobium meliloti]
MRVCPAWERLINEWAANDYSLHQVVREGTYRWVLEHVHFNPGHILLLRSSSHTLVARRV